MSRVLTLKEQNFLKLLFERLNKNKIPAIFLRNYQDFPQKIGNDIDLFIPRSKLSIAKKILETTLTEFQGELYIHNQRDYFLDLRFKVDPACDELIHLDFYHGAYTWHGLKYLSDSELISDSKSNSFFHVPDPAHEAISLLFTSLLWGSFFKERYKDRILELLSKPEVLIKFKNILKINFGNKSIDTFEELLKNSADKNYIKNKAKQLRKMLFIKKLTHSFGLSTVTWIRYWFVELYKFTFPQGLFISFQGPKCPENTRILEQCHNQIVRWFADSKFHQLRPSLLPDIEESTGGPHKLEDISSFKRSCKSFNFLLRLSYALFILRKNLGQSKLIFFSQYTDDPWSNSKHFLISLKINSLRLFLKTVHTPALSVVLLTENDAILQNSMKNYQLLTERQNLYFTIKSIENSDKIAREIEAKVLDLLRRRL